MNNLTVSFPGGRSALRITPGAGFEYISNGEVWSKEITLGASDSLENWHDTNEEPPASGVDLEADISDYEAALGRFGV